MDVVIGIAIEGWEFIYKYYGYRAQMISPGEMMMARLNKALERYPSDRGEGLEVSGVCIFVVKSEVAGQLSERGSKDIAGSKVVQETLPPYTSMLFNNSSVKLYS